MVSGLGPCVAEGTLGSWLDCHCEDGVAPIAGHRDGDHPDGYHHQRHTMHRAQRELVECVNAQIPPGEADPYRRYKFDQGEPPIDDDGAQSLEQQHDRAESPAERRQDPTGRCQCRQGALHPRGVGTHHRASKVGHLLSHLVQRMGGTQPPRPITAVARSSMERLVTLFGSDRRRRGRS